MVASVGENVTGYRYIAHLYCLAVQAGFYSDVVECSLSTRENLVRSPLGKKDFFFACYIFNVKKLFKKVFPPTNPILKFHVTGNTHFLWPSTCNYCMYSLILQVYISYIYIGKKTSGLVVQYMTLLKARGHWFDT